MGLNTTPSAERVHIGVFGRRNAGKSSIVNAITSQNLAIVSDVAGTTTDPVYKAMELLPLGPVMVIDTPGLDDEGTLGQLRVEKALQVLGKTDIALLVADCRWPLGEVERHLIREFQEREVPYLLVRNKMDLLGQPADTSETHTIFVSAATGENIYQLRERIAALVPEQKEKRLVGDLLCPADLVVLVVPIDKSAPKGRLILPQQQTIRDVLDSRAVSVAVQETQLREVLTKLGIRPRLVITDSQAFHSVAQDTPEDIPLTSFSILMARYKGDLPAMVKGIRALEGLKDGDQILISEGCTHHRQCEDIGTVKLPKALAAYTGKNLELHVTSGTEFPEELSPYSLIIHCGGCMLNDREMHNRLRRAERQGVPMTNYGVFLAQVNGILKRSLEPFPEVLELLENE